LRPIETIEYSALRAWFDAALRADVDWTERAFGDAVCFASRTERSILVNRVLGLGSAAPVTQSQLRDIRQYYADQGVGRFFLHVVPEWLGPDREDLLTDSGFERYRGWMKFTRNAEPLRAAETELSLRRIDKSQAGDFARIVAQAFDFNPAFEPAIAALLEAPGWQAFMAFDDDVAAGTGALYTSGRFGYLDFGATHPDFRRRGAQTASLRLRLQSAVDAGCETVITMTGEAVPGDEQHSYRNIEKTGFRAAYLRENWIPTGS
jgi:hypothetical protein